ncbi:DDE-type integrase/transposase/recombinase [Pseudooceanicola spongiae]|nr:DDE-type integrase/transposase/recombinase [Pseudooceanicola spongiae]
MAHWFGVPLRTAYDKPISSASKIDPRFADPIKSLIEEEPFFGYRTIAWLLGFNKNTVKGGFQLKGWQVRKRAVGMRPRVQAIPSVATARTNASSRQICFANRLPGNGPTDLARFWAAKDGWASLALVIDCHTHELLGWHLSRSRKATIASAALEHALIARFGTLGRVEQEFLLRSDNGLVFTSRPFAAQVAQRRAAAGVHHPALPPTERHGRARHPDAQGAMCSPPSFRKHPACEPSHRRLDQLLQKPPPSSGACHTHACRGIQRSGLT